MKVFYFFIASNHSIAPLPEYHINAIHYASKTNFFIEGIYLDRTEQKYVTALHTGMRQYYFDYHIRISKLGEWRMVISS